MNKHMNTHRSLRLRTLNSARTWLPQAGLLLALGALPMLATAQGQASVMRPPAHPAAKESPQEPNQLLHIPKAQTGKAMAPVMSGGGCEVVLPEAAADRASVARGGAGCKQGPGARPAPSPLSEQPGTPSTGRPGAGRGGNLQNLALLDRGEAAQVPPAVLAQRKAEQGDVVLASYSPPPAQPQAAAAVQPKAAGDAVGIPTLSQWGLVILASLVGAASLRATSKRG